METVKGDLPYSLILHMLLTLAITIVLIFLALSTITASLLLRQPILALDLYDNFEGPPYTLSDNKTSLNGKWFNKYNGFGESGTVAVSPLTMVDTTNSTVFYEQPKTSTSHNETHAALTLTTQTYEDVEIQLKVKTNEQLRQNSTPNPWEVAWIMWRFQDDWHHYYFIFKPNGVELGKKQNENQAEEQIFLYTANEPQLKINEWSIWHIKMSGNHIETWLKMADGSWQRVVDYYDKTPIVGPGNIGLYTEDAHVQFDDVYISSLSP